MAPGRRKSRMARSRRPRGTPATSAADSNKQLEQQRRLASGMPPTFASTRRPPGTRRYDEAIRLYERALEAQPTNAVLLIDVARACTAVSPCQGTKFPSIALPAASDDVRLQVCWGERTCTAASISSRPSAALIVPQRNWNPTRRNGRRSTNSPPHMYERLHRLKAKREPPPSIISRSPRISTCSRCALPVVDRQQGPIA